MTHGKSLELQTSRLERRVFEYLLPREHCAIWRTPRRAWRLPPARSTRSANMTAAATPCIVEEGGVGGFGRTLNLLVEIVRARRATGGPRRSAFDTSPRELRSRRSTDASDSLSFVILDRLLATFESTRARTLSLAVGEVTERISKHDLELARALASASDNAITLSASPIESICLFPRSQF